jgi:predicted dithiol-disulfide oxidoreductase (DUF899 family)
MYTTLLSAWEGEVKQIEQRIALVAVARSPIQRLVAFNNQCGWRGLKIYADGSRAHVSLSVDNSLIFQNMERGNPYASSTLYFL